MADYASVMNAVPRAGVFAEVLRSRSLWLGADRPSRDDHTPRAPGILVEQSPGTPYHVAACPFHQLVLDPS